MDKYYSKIVVYLAVIHLIVLNKGEDKMAERKDPGKQGWGWGVLIPVAVIIFIGLWLPVRLEPVNPGGGLLIAWLINVILMLVIAGLIGYALNKGPFGILIDSRNMMSLSRLQMLLWTIVIVSAFITVGLARVADTRVHPGRYVCETVVNEAGEEEPEADCATPLDLQVPSLLWTLMGISLASAVSSPLLKNFKAQRTAEEDRRRKNAATKTSLTLGGEVVEPATYDNRLKESASETPEEVTLQNEGALVKKSDWLEARFSDVFMGEEVGNFMYVDIAKVQNFLFSVFAVAAYAAALGMAMSGATSIAKFFAFPELSEGLVTVIGISHGGYLTDKAFTHATPTEPAPQQ